ncbi:eight-cysteine-cluster domain-containing protein [Candidatus Woesearchaeota archaeon]|nr:eight-cysteine-cluster domain-containing protein [Candidatus Woesearchaeota archaeon]MBW3022348.1 eight-cysteine-cluster domain-containing protein [Candidatus Woesearchaeota archaeon]
MKTIIIILLILSVFFIGCKMVEVECSTDADCVKAGCSGTICQSNDAEKVFTTCEYKPEYECYKDAGCGCYKGECVWKDDVEECLKSFT